jgi:rhamnosyltransferase
MQPSGCGIAIRDMVVASILILTKNGGDDFRESIDAVFSQTDVCEFEVIVVDSGSTDGTLAVARRYPVRLEEIRAQEFHHARTRNFAAQLARGKYLVYLTQDAIPASRVWLKALLDNFENPSIGAVYGRQIPKIGAGLERHEVLSSLYGDSRLVKHHQDGLGYKRYHFSSVNSAIRKELWDATRFPDELKVFEDIGIAKRILDSHWSIAYEPQAAVYHSHEFPLGFLLKRYFDIGVVYQRLGIWDSDTRSSLRTAGWRGLHLKLSRLLHGGERREMGSSLMKDIGKFAAIELGRHEKALPLAMKKRLSAYNLFD